MNFLKKNHQPKVNHRDLLSKTLLTLLTALLMTLSGFAQQGINYKAVIKDGNGNVFAGQPIDVKFSILEDSGSTVVYTEDHNNIMTDANGIVITNIGEGTTSDDFSAIDWESDTHSLKTEIDLDDDTNYEVSETTQFKSVPYAKQAEKAANVFSGDYNDLTNQPTIPDPLAGFAQFENIFAFYATGIFTFTVPSGVTKIGIELLGGGGAGSNNGGGAGGNYLAVIKQVNPGAQIDIETGLGGSYNGSSNDGFSSTVTLGGVTYTAHGGFGAGAAQRGGNNNFNFLGLGNYFRALGQPGTANDYSYSYGPGGNTIFKTIYGSGGGTYPSYTYTPGGSRLKNLNTNTDLNITECTSPFAFGSGGAAGITLNSRNSGRGGFVRIHY